MSDSAAFKINRAPVLTLWGGRDFPIQCPKYVARMCIAKLQLTNVSETCRPDLHRPHAARVDGPIAPLHCLLGTAYRRCDDCKDEMSCELRIVFAKAYSDYLATLVHLSLVDVMRQSDGSIPGANPVPTSKITV